MEITKKELKEVLEEQRKEYQKYLEKQEKNTKIILVLLPRILNLKLNLLLNNTVQSRKP